MDIMNELYELCETISRAIIKANEKIRTSGGVVSSADMDYINNLTHSLKSVKTTMAMIEGEESGDGYSGRGYSREGSYARGGRRYSRDGGSYDGGSYDGRSYARGRGRNARRDSMGRYSNDGYSRDGEDMVEELRELMERAPDEQTRQEFQRMIKTMEQR